MKRTLNGTIEVSFSEKVCYSCAHWCGERQVTGQVQVPRNPPSAKCKKRCGTVYFPESDGKKCDFWTKIK